MKARELLHMIRKTYDSIPFLRKKGGNLNELLFAVRQTEQDFFVSYLTKDDQTGFGHVNGFWPVSLLEREVDSYGVSIGDGAEMPTLYIVLEAER